jgi:glycosyltransferase involved in cell wall biosynthesis
MAEGKDDRTPSASVVIPARNAARYLHEQLAALTNQTFDGRWEVVIADNGSTDGTAEVARAWSAHLPRLRITRTARRGANAARNEGAGEAGGEVLAFCDADDRVSPGWLEALVNAIEHAEIATGQLEYELLNDADVRAWRYPPAVDADGLHRGMDFLPYAPSGNLAVRASVFQSLGGFPTSYRGGCDEVSFSWRAQLDGYQIGFAPDAVLHYRYRERRRDLVRQFAGIGFMQPRLFREFRSVGMPRRTAANALREWRSVTKGIAVPHPSAATREAWIASAALLAGRVAGSLQQRVLYL